jgi:1,4-dihydroxy-6-naphthoate synthase
MSTLVRIGHSPDSDDAFMFYGLASGSVQTPGIQYEHVLRDIQTLNEWAREGRLETTAISVHAYAYVADRYAILTHGASMGDGYGPMVVTRQPAAVADLRGKVVAIPGLMTSAYLALSLYLDEPMVEEGTAGGEGAMRYRVMPFDAIMPAVIAGEVDAGLLIHEGQLTYGDAGLSLMVDLGAWWKERTGLPLPLGVNAIRRDLCADLAETISRDIKKSIVLGLEHRPDALDYALTFARDMPAATADRFVGMYVNSWTVDMGEAGKRSIRLFLEEARSRGLAPSVGEIDFVD